MGLMVVANAAVAAHLHDMAAMSEAFDPACARDLYRAAARLYEIAAQYDLSTQGRGDLAQLAERSRGRAEELSCPT